MHTSASIATALLLSTTTNTLHGQDCEAPVDLHDWAPESYPLSPGFPPGLWTVATDGASVLQSQNGQPTLFFSDFDAQGSAVEGVLQVGSTGDDDFIGFALGFRPGDAANTAANYLLVDWKRGLQGFGSSACAPGSIASPGLAVSRVLGLPSEEEFWGHVNFDAPCSDLNSGLTELARGVTLGTTGWVVGASYRFRFEFTATRLRVFVGGNLEIDLPGAFSGGRMAFYNYSQNNVEYRAFSRGVLASLVEYGSGTPSSLGVVPALSFSGVPRQGSAIEAIVPNPWDQNTRGCLLIGTQPTQQLVFRFELLVQQTREIPLLLPPLGEARVRWNVPTGLGTCGLKFFVQAILLDPSPSVLVAASRGIEVTVGD